MPGCAITGVDIEGVLHEYSAIEGVQEDVMEIMLNLKGVAFRWIDRDEAIVPESTRMARSVTAGDIQLTTI